VTGDRTFEYVLKFKYLGTEETNRSGIHGEVRQIEFGKRLLPFGFASLCAFPSAKPQGIFEEIATENIGIKEDKIDCHRKRIKPCNEGFHRVIVREI
jgi:hypothetical protein